MEPAPPPKTKRRRTGAEAAPLGGAAPDAGGAAAEGEGRAEPARGSAAAMPRAGCLRGEAAKARWARVCAAFSALEGAYFGRRDAALRQAASVSGAAPGSGVPARAAGPSEVVASGAAVTALAGGGSAVQAAVGQHLAAFSDDLSKYALHTRLKVGVKARTDALLLAVVRLELSRVTRMQHIF